MELQGKVIAALPERSGVSQRGEWKSQEFVIQYQEGQYPRHLCFTVFGAERLQRFNIQIGQYVLVAFDIDAHDWNGRWFTDIRAFDVRQIDPNAVPASNPFPAEGQPAQQAPVMNAAVSPAANDSQNPTAPFPPADDKPEQGADDLPF